MNYESWCKVASVLTLCSLGCKEGLTSPPQRELRPASIDAAVVDQSTAFPTGAPDTTLLKSWRLYSYSSSCNSQVLEIRISAFAADGSGPDYRALYVSSASTSEVTEDAPAVAFRPHDNTIERVSAEAYTKNYFCVLRREFEGVSWYYNANGGMSCQTIPSTEHGQPDDLTCVRLSWAPASYAIGSTSISPTTIDAGTSTQLVSHAYALGPPVQTEIFNQATTAWSSSNPSVASIAGGTGSRVVSSFGEPWGNYTMGVTGYTAGATTISTSIGGASLNAVLHVLPTGSLSDPTGGTNHIYTPDGTHGL